MVAWRMVTRLLGVISTVILARLLTQADFGIVALAVSISQALENLTAVGVNDALIQRAEPDRATFDTGFTLNLLRSAFVALCIAAGASAAGGFFGDNRLTWVLFALAAITMLGGCENIGVVQFRRSLAFGKEFLFLAVPRFSGLLATVAFAVVLRNYWALIAGIASLRAVRLILSYWIHPYRPGITLRAWRRIIGFSFWTWINAVAIVIKDRTDGFVIGHVLGPAKVGIYAVGSEIGTLAATELVEPLTASLFSGLSAGNREGADTAQVYFRAISTSFLVTLPIDVGISLVAAPLVTLMFGARWLDAIPLVRIFALLGVTKAIPYFSSVLLAAHAKLRIRFWIVMAGLTVRLVLLFALIGPLGVIGAVIAALACSLTEDIIFLIVTFHIFRLRLLDLPRAIWRSVLAAAVMALVVVSEGIGWAPAASGDLHLVTDLLTALSTGAVTYCAVLLMCWWLSGMPDGAERTLLTLARQIARNLRWRPA